MTSSIGESDEQRVQERLVASLRRGAAFPNVDPASIEHLETHISQVLLVGDHAYKIKKALNLGFLDFTGVGRRRRYCDEEIRLNRRLAPELYLDSVPITGTPENPQLGGNPDAAIEFAVRMRRFHQDALLDRIAAAGQLSSDLIAALAGELAAFHATAPSATEARFGAPQQVVAPMLENFRHLRELVSDPRLLSELEVVENWTRNQAESLAETLAQRRQLGFVRECHGDVHLGNVAVIEGRPVLFDCIEFNEDFRWTDVMSDLGFLMMDLDARGFRNEAWQALNVYLERSGDYGGLAVLPLYRCYRAMVRAKIAAIRSSQGDQIAWSECQHYLHLARDYTEPSLIGLVMTHGVSGSGKSTITRALYPALGAVRLRSDVERKRLFGIPADQSAAAAPGSGIYGSEAGRRVYRRLAELTRQVLQAGFSAIVDAATLQRWQRETLTAAAESLQLPTAILVCQVPEPQIREWLRQRHAHGGDPSDADERVLDSQLQQLESPSPTEAASLTVSSQLPVDAEQLAQRLRATWKRGRAASPGPND